MYKTFILLFFLFFGCTLNMPDDPKPPKWEIAVEKIPFLKADTLRIGDQLTSEDFARMGEDSILTLNVEDFTSFKLKDNLKIDGQDKNFSDEVGVFKISTDESYSTAVNFAELYPDYTQLIGATVVIPPVPLLPIEKTVSYTQFVSMSIDSGGIMVDVENKLGFPFGNQIRMELIDIASGNQSITVLNITESIPDGQTGSYWIDLAGKTVSSNFNFSISGSLNGSNGQAVYISNESGINISMQPRDIIVSKAVAYLPQQSFELTGSVDISSDTLTIKEAEIEQGYIDIIVSSQFEFPISLDLSTPELVNENGDVITANIYANPGNTEVTRIQLDRTTLDLSDGDLDFIVAMQIYPNNQNVYELNASDELSVSVVISDILLDNVTADFNLLTEFPEIQEEVFEDAPTELDNLQFHEAIMKISMPKSPFDVELDIELAAIKNGTETILRIDKKLNKGEELILSKDGINYDGSTPTIVDIINTVPEEIRIYGDIRVIGENVTISAEDVIDVEYSIEFPLSFSLSGASYSDTDSLDLDDDAREELTDLTFSGHLEMTVINALPISGSLSLHVGPDSLNVNDELFSIQLPASITSNGIVVEPGVSSLSIGLDESDVELISNSYFYRYKANLDDSQLSTITANDNIIVEQVFLSGKLLVETDDE